LLERATPNPTAQSKTTGTKIRNVTRRLGQERIDRLVADYRDDPDMTTTALMEKYSLSKTSVIHLIEANGVALRRQGLSKRQATEAALLYEQGRSLSAITEQLQLPRESIRRALVDAGVEMRGRGGSTGRARRSESAP